VNMFQFYGLGAYLYGALALIGLFVLGIAQDNLTASVFAVAACGAAYFCQISAASGSEGLVGAQRLAFGTQILSIVFGAAALVSLVM